MFKWKRIVAIMIVMAIAGGAVFAMGDKEAGKDDMPKTVIVYSSVDEGNTKKLLDAFTADTGITAQFVQLSSGPALARIKAEAANPQADVWLGAPSENHIVAKKDGLTIPHTGGNLASLQPAFKDPEGYWRSFYMNPMAFAINKDILARSGASMPKSWADLLDPAYKGQIQMPTPQSSGTAYNVVASLVTMMGEEKAYDYMKRLGPNIQTYTSSGTAPSKGVSVGQCMIGLQFTPAFFEFIDQGFPLVVVFPAEGVWFESPAVSILKGGPNLKAAQILVEWLSSPKGQSALTEQKTYFYPIIPGVKLGAGMPAFETLKTIAVDPLWAGAEKKRLVERWVAEVLPAK
ncbi:MAG: ABC transporter substrate-binding protein [Spirochaetae bacterium HGW-Spirochaetae-3]|jgi:iron(III) transport system substrate-binding protein|nr:MAG: ABC transporter substrate-binding protein [Spirochaetae bacterium HGW-Spirochaetae-3]